MVDAWIVLTSMFYTLLAIWLQSYNQAFAGISSDVHERCIDAKDYAGCVRLNQDVEPSAEAQRNPLALVRRRPERSEWWVQHRPSSRISNPR